MLLGVVLEPSYLGKFAAIGMRKRNTETAQNDSENNLDNPRNEFIYKCGVSGTTLTSGLIMDTIPTWLCV